MQRSLRNGINRYKTMDAKQLKRLEIEAIARITWGESPAQVRAWLMSMELRDFYADAMLRDCLRRRAQEMRSLGMRNLIWGLGAMAPAVLLGGGGWLLVEWLSRIGVEVPAHLFAVFFVPAAFFFGYGLWQLGLAFDRLVFGARADGAVSDIE